MNYHSSLISQRVLKHALRQGIASISIAVLCGCSANTQTAPSTGSPPATSKNATTTSSAPILASNSSTPVQKADTESDSKALAAKVLPPDTWTGHTRMSYMVAKEIPEILQQLFCHCGCDQTDDHVSLYDCYTCNHSVDCPECKGEAMMACKMTRKGASIAEIQKAVDLNWAPKYPFSEQPSDALKKYWKTRLWAPGPGPTAAEKYNLEHKPIDPFTGSQEASGKSKGSPSGSCCGSNKEATTAKTVKQ